MKRKLALLILMILALSIVLVACNNTVNTEVACRWTEDKYTFNITLADFTKNHLVDKATYLKDRAIDNGNVIIERFPGAEDTDLDEILPLDVSGTYTLEITQPNNKQWKVTTDQTIYAKYNKADLTLTDTELQKVQAPETDITNLTSEGDTVILKSTTHTAVVFEDSDQKPISSKTEVTGFYVGKAHQEVTSYNVETIYDHSDSRSVAKISVNGEKLDDYKFARNASFIDANQILMYTRSLDKSNPTSNGGFQDAPSVTVFNPYDQQTSTATFSLTYDGKMILSNYEREEEINTSVNVVSVLIGGVAFMQQENIPDTLKSIDMCPGKDASQKFTTVRFRVGYLAYELNYGDNLWEALKPAPAAEADGE